MRQEVEKRSAILIDELKNSKLSVEDKCDLEAVIQQAAETTNGLDIETRVKGISLVLFDLVAMMVSKRLDGSEGRWSGLYKVLVECRIQITIIVGIIATMLILRPDLSALVGKLISVM